MTDSKTNIPKRVRIEALGFKVIVHIPKDVTPMSIKQYGQRVRHEPVECVVDNGHLMSQTYPFIVARPSEVFISNNRMFSLRLLFQNAIGPRYEVTGENGVSTDIDMVGQNVYLAAIPICEQVFQRRGIKSDMIDPERPMVRFMSPRISAACTADDIYDLLGQCPDWLNTERTVIESGSWRDLPIIASRKKTRAPPTS